MKEVQFTLLVQLTLLVNDIYMYIVYPKSTGHWNKITSLINDIRKLEWHSHAPFSAGYPKMISLCFTIFILFEKKINLRSIWSSPSTLFRHLHYLKFMKVICYMSEKFMHLLLKLPKQRNCGRQSWQYG